MNGDYYRFALSLAKQASSLIKKNFTLSMKKQWKDDNSPVTATDLEINQLVIEAVKKKFPEHAVLGEEDSLKRVAADYVWVCDPIDGTIPFAHGVPTCVFVLALVHKGRSIFGVVSDPFLNRVFSAWKNGGSWLNGQRCRVSRQKVLKNSLLGVAHWKLAPFNLSHLAARLSDLDVKIMNVGSIAYLSALVAGGEFVGTVYAGDTPYETAALKIIVEEAGGLVTDLFGEDQRYDQAIKGHIVSNGYVHDSLLRIVRMAMTNSKSCCGPGDRL